MTTTYRRSGGLAALLAAAAIALSACSGSSSPADSQGTSAPIVASLPTTTSAGTGIGNSNGSGSSTTLPQSGDATQLLNDWGGCMRRHGDPGQADPTVDASKVIHITMLPSVPGGIFGQDRNTDSGPGTHCQAYLTTAITALRGGQQLEPPDQAQLVKYAECMRANGVPNFPDPAGGGLQIPASTGSDLDPNNPALQNAAKVCAKKTGVYPPGGGGPLPPGAISLGPASGPGSAIVWYSGGNGGAGASD